MKDRECRKCGRILPLDQFPIHKECKDGHVYECRDCKRKRNREYMRKRRKEHPEILRAQQKKYREYYREYHRQEYRRLREAAINAYGGKCACCGETALAFLTIDHVNNDGNVHRSRAKAHSGVQIYRWLEKKGYPQDGRFQVLCYNCNCSKQHDPVGHRAAHPRACLIDGWEDDELEE